MAEASRQRMVVAIVLAATLAGAPLLTGFILAGDDAFAYYMYAQQTAANLRDGAILPAWAADLNRGFGGAGLLFYPPFTSYVHAIPALLGLPLVPGVGVLAVLAHVLGGLAALAWLRAAGAGAVALPASLVYTLAPYRMLDLYERAALAEHWAFLWPPLILWAAVTPRLRPRGQAVVIALATAALLLTNLPLALLCGATLAVWALTRQRPVRSLPLVGGAVLGAGVAAIALVSAALASRWVRTELEFGSTAPMFRCSSNTLFNPLAIEPAFNVRASIVVLTTAALALLAFFLVGTSMRRRREPLVWLVIALGWALSTTAFAGPIWDHTPAFSMIQFPWRAAAPMTLTLAALVALVPTPRRAWIMAAAAIVAALPHTYQNLARASVLDSGPSGSHIESLTFPDHAALRAAGALAADIRIANPHFTDRSFKLRAASQVMLDGLDGKGSPALRGILQRPASILAEPAVRVDVLHWGRLDRTLRVESENGGSLVWHSFLFPEMTIEVDGRPAAVAADGTTGLLSHPLPAGNHEVRWRWSPPAELVLGRLVSACSLVVLLGLAFTLMRGRRVKSG
jgi:hypothetical protein